jgi:DNA-binding CsgD family transcriptional regulator
VKAYQILVTGETAMGEYEGLSTTIDAFYAASTGSVSWEHAFTLAQALTGADRIRLEGGDQHPALPLAMSVAAGHSGPHMLGLDALPGLAVGPCAWEATGGRMIISTLSAQGSHAPFSGLTMTLARMPHHPCFSAKDRMLASMLTPHILRAISLAEKLRALAASRDNFAYCLERMAPQAFLVAEDRTILHANDGGSRYLALRQTLRELGGKLHLTRSGLNTELTKEIQRAEEGSFVLRLDGSDGTLLLTGIRLPPRDGAPHRAALLIVTDAGSQVDQPLQVFRDAFALTTSEARVLGALIMGGSREMIAKELGLSLSTVKTHMQNLFAKTGVNRQAQLVRMAMALPKTAAVPRGKPIHFKASSAELAF